MIKSISSSSLSLSYRVKAHSLVQGEKLRIKLQVATPSQFHYSKINQHSYNIVAKQKESKAIY
jgi:hypothetical protein